ncbi:hypothetical protein IEO70_00445 [Bacillus sp. AGMB 02131]|uniref:Copper amine oxidase-like N-terminal domain-containing protein n=1 Tax=Peribacillus faecalis TaxID=2772559 RepID=A0A927CWF2_9BACI|nr:stalk domain-containing protein [Peribacillus faecalis]MBD3106845.1 hypothetical protein [Peribacillus faecalis]
MRKALYLLTFILVMTVGAIVMWQWKVYSEAKGLSEKTQTSAEQFIRVEQTSKRLSVIQTFSGLEAGTYKVANPMGVAYTIEGRDEMAPVSVVVGEDESEIIFVYDIPFEPNRPGKILVDWAVELIDIETRKTRVEITVTGDKRAGSWAAGAPLIGNAKKDYIDYYMFENEGSVYPIYYQNGQLMYLEVRDMVGLYYEEGTKIEEMKQLLQESSFLANHFIVLTSKHDPSDRQNLFLLDSRQSMDKHKSRFANMEMNAAFSFADDNERWLQKVLNSLVNDAEPGGAKAGQLVQVLKQNLLDYEMDAFIKSIEEMKQPLTAKLLDGALSSAVNKNTSFFSLNNLESAAMVPLFYYDERKILLNGAQSEQPIVYIDKKKAVPFLAIISNAGFQYEQMETGEVFLTRAEDTLRMYPGEKVFILNGTDYSVKSPPIFMLGQELYIYENWLRDIFGIKLAEQQGNLTVLGD